MPGQLFERRNIRPFTSLIMCSLHEADRHLPSYFAVKMQNFRKKLFSVLVRDGAMDLEIDPQLLVPPLGWRVV